MIESIYIYYITALLMIFIGLPHGANDIIIMHKSWGTKKSIFASIAYFLFFLSGIILWRISSNSFLLLLWIISALHFWDVEKYFRKNDKMAFEDIMYFSLFTLPCLMPNDFSYYMKSLNGEIFYSLFNKSNFLIFTGQIILSIYSLIQNRKSKYFGLHLSSYIVVGYLITKLNLLLSFFLIFIFVHSLRHLKLSFKRGIFNYSSYLKILLPTSIFSFLLILLAGKSLSFDQNQLLFFTVGLGSLAFPHYFLDFFIRKSK